MTSTKPSRIEQHRTLEEQLRELLESRGLEILTINAGGRESMRRVVRLDEVHSDATFIHVLASRDRVNKPVRKPRRKVEVG